MQDIALTDIDVQIAEQTDDLPGQWTEVGWLPPHDLTQDDWMGVGPKLSGVLDAIHWWVGDWIVYGEHKFGEAHAQAVDATNFEYNTVQKDAWVARSIPYDQRRPELSYTHHRNLASSDINHAERNALMDMAIANGWTTKLTLSYKLQWIQRRESLLALAREDGKQSHGLTTGTQNPLPELPETPTVEQVMHHINKAEQERKTLQKSYRRGTAFPQIYDQNTGELSSAWRGIWPRMCEECRDRFMESERAAWTTEEDSVEPGRQDSST